MELIEQQSNRPPFQGTKSQSYLKDQKESFLIPINQFKNSINFSIKIHFLRFIFVTLIYYFQDSFLVHNQKNYREVWSSLLFFLAIMIQIIKFIGDCSLRNLLKLQEKKLCQIHEIREQRQANSQANPNIVLKAAKYEDYMYIFSIVRIFKYEHRNYSSAYSISKNLHLICTFLVFGWMSLKEHYNSDSNILQLLALQAFLLSIYFTSFEIDLYMIQTSQGRFISKLNYTVSSLSESQRQMVYINFKTWRDRYLRWQNIGTLLIIIGVCVQFNLSLLTFTITITSVLNMFGCKLQKQILKQCSNAMRRMKREQINTYSLLNRSTQNKKHLFRIFVILQRVSYLFIWFSYARDQSLSLLKFSIIGIGIVFLIVSQRSKFKFGNKLKLMRIAQVSYVNQNASENNAGKQVVCAICLQNLQVDQKVQFLPCSKQHVFHSQCFKDWKEYKNQCPLCRYQLSDYV